MRRRALSTLLACLLALLAGCTRKAQSPPPVATRHGPPSGTGKPCPPQQLEDPGNFEQDTCPQVCSITGDNNTVFDVDRWMATGADPGVCLVQNPKGTYAPDSVLWVSQDTNFRIVSFAEKRTGKGHPFQSDPPFPNGGGFQKGFVRSPGLASKVKPADNMCFTFKTHIEVMTSTGPSCYDPHIYVGCCTQ